MTTREYGTLFGNSREDSLESQSGSSALPFRTYNDNTSKSKSMISIINKSEVAPDFVNSVILQDKKLEQEKNQNKMARNIFSVILLLFVSFGVFAYVQQFNLMSIWTGNIFLESGIDLDLSITASHEDYGQYSGNYPWLEGSQLVEPYKGYKFSLTGADFQPLKYQYKWTNSYDDEVVWAKSIEKTVNDTGSFYMTVSKYPINSETDLIGSYTTKVIVKYVKRELRALNEIDKARFLNAAATLWRYSTTKGRKHYGDKYTSAAEFVEEHALASNDIRCDSFHEGTGFFSHHFAITQSFEAALRAVDPSVTLPYWDFTIEGQAITDAGEIPSYMMKITPFLSADWFGSVDEDNHIQDSLFANVPMPRVSESSIVNPNSFGYIRSYWNNNDDEEVTRHLFDVCGIEPTNKQVPDCSSHYDVLNTAALANFQLLSPSDGHGPMHVFMGGIDGDCVDAYTALTEKWADVLDADMTEDEITGYGYSVKTWEWGLTGSPRRKMVEKSVMGEYFHIYRSLWRSHMCSRNQTAQLLQCPESCEVGSDCKCTVTALETGETDWTDVYDCVLSDRNRELFDAVFPEDFNKELVTMIATTSVKEGEMIEAASPADIIFWVLHPTIERLLAAKRVNDNSYTFGGTPFKRFSVTDGSNETWYSYSYYSLEEGDNAAYPDAYTCIGHAADDSVLTANLPWLDGFEDFADADGDGTITNMEYYLAIDPNNVDGLDYVFDNFEWDHCDGKITASNFGKTGTTSDVIDR